MLSLGLPFDEWLYIFEEDDEKFVGRIKIVKNRGGGMRCVLDVDKEKLVLREKLLQKKHWKVIRARDTVRIAAVGRGK